MTTIDSMPPPTAWKCYAKPAALGGKTCGHENTQGISSHVTKSRCCEKCGCTKIASDLRREKETK